MIWALIAVIVIVGITLYAHRKSLEDLIERVDQLEERNAIQDEDPRATFSTIYDDLKQRQEDTGAKGD